jgi:hypothetical protein
MAEVGRHAWPGRFSMRCGLAAERVRKGATMRVMVLRRLMMVASILVLPVVVHAQEATLSGTVTDSTGGVLPGTTVRAVHVASGNAFEAVTDERGGYRIAVRVGV